MEFFVDNDYESQSTEAQNHSAGSLPEDSPHEKLQEDFPNEDSPMNSQSEDTGNISNENPSGKPFPNVFALFAKSLGAFSIFCAVFSVFFGSFICGGMAIILAVLSKGYDSKMEKNAKIGLATGLIGITLQIFMFAFSLYNVIHVPEFREQFDSMYEQMYGEPMDDSIHELLDQWGLPSEEGGFL